MNLLMLMLSTRITPLAISLLLLTLFSRTVQAAPLDDLNVSGFGTIASATADTEKYRFRADRSQEASAKKDGLAFKPLSLIGLQLDYSFTQELDFVGQFVYREQDNQDLDSITQMAFFRYNLNRNWQIRAGRSAADIFQFSDTRDIGISYPWVKVPTEVYGVLPTRSFDGFDISYSRPFNNFNFSIKAISGQAESDFTSNAYRPIRFENLIGVGIELDSFDWSFSIKHTVTDAANNNPDSAAILPLVQQLQPIWPGAIGFSQQLSIEDAEIEYSSVYAERYMGSYHLSGELSHIDSTSLGLRHSLNGFINLSYLNGEHTYYVLYSFADTDPYYLEQEKPDFPLLPQTRELALFVEEIANSLGHNQSTISVGWRWDLAEQLAFKVQVERTDISARGAGLRADRGLVVNSTEKVAHSLFFALSFSF